MDEHVWSERHRQPLRDRYGVAIAEEVLQHYWSRYQRTGDERFLSEGLLLSRGFGLECESMLPLSKQRRLHKQKVRARAQDFHRSPTEDRYHEEPKPSAARLDHELADFAFSALGEQRLEDFRARSMQRCSRRAQRSDEEQALAEQGFAWIQSLRADATVLYLRACLLENENRLEFQGVLELGALFCIYEQKAEHLGSVARCGQLLLRDGVLRGWARLDLEEAAARCATRARWGLLVANDTEGLPRVGAGVQVDLRALGKGSFALEFDACLDVPDGERVLEEHRLMLLGCVPPEGRSTA